jgi:hypothetical protein
VGAAEKDERRQGDGEAREVAQEEREAVVFSRHLAAARVRVAAAASVVVLVAGGAWCPKEFRGGGGLVVVLRRSARVAQHAIGALCCCVGLIEERAAGLFSRHFCVSRKVGRGAGGARFKSGPKIKEKTGKR